MLYRLAWHPRQNGFGVEAAYMDLVDHFLTTYFKQAKDAGDEELVKYFNAFNGVCFEDRARNMEKFISESSSEFNSVADVADYDSSSSIDEVFTKELQTLFNQIQRLPTPDELYNHLAKKDVFNTEFGTQENSKEKPSLETFHNWVLEQNEKYIVDFYNHNVFFKTEYKILVESGKDISSENFIEQIKSRAKKQPVMLKSPVDEDDEIELEINDSNLVDVFSRLNQGNTL